MKWLRGMVYVWVIKRRRYAVKATAAEITECGSAFTRALIQASGGGTHETH